MTYMSQTEKGRPGLDSELNSNCPDQINSDLRINFTQLLKCPQQLPMHIWYSFKMWGYFSTLPRISISLLGALKETKKATFWIRLSRNL